MRTRELPPPLPPRERTVGQVIAETIRAYGDRFWRVLPLGIPVAVVDQLSVRESPGIQMLVWWAATPLFVAAYLYACSLALNARPNRTAIAVAVLIYLPFPALRALFILPGIAWFALVGLAVPAAMVEGLRFRDALVRGRQLALADYAHALGSLAALVVISDLVLSPLLFLGAALLYLDQSARVGSDASDRRRRRDAHFHPPVDTDAAGRHDAQVEP